MRRLTFCLPLATALCLGSAAFAEDVEPVSDVLTIDAPRPPRIDPERQAPPEDAASEQAATPDGQCQRNPDRSPHGMVEGAVGSGGYRSGTVIVTAPVGDCGSVTIGVQRSSGGYRGGYPNGRHRH